MENQDQGNYHSPVDAKIMERRRSEKSIGGIGATSTRPEDEVFSDAVMEFQDTGFDLDADNTGEGFKFVDKDLTPAVSFKDCEDIGILRSPLNSADGSQKENPVPKSMPILLTDIPEHNDVGLSYGNDSEDKDGSAGDVVLIEMETVKGVSEETREAGTGAGAGADADENEDGMLNENLSSDSVQPSKHGGEILETESSLGKRLDVASDMDQLKEECSDRLSSDTRMSGNDEQETDGKGKHRVTFEENLIDASLKSISTEDLTSETGLADKTVELEENSEKLALNVVVDYLSTKAESSKDINVPTDTFEIQTDAALGTDLSIDVDSNEVDEKKEKEKESVYVLSVPDDIHVVDDAEIKLIGFKDHKGVKLFQSEALASEEIILDKEDEIKDTASQEKSDTFVYNPMDEDIVTEDYYKLGVNNEAMAKEVLFSGNADAIQIDKGSDALSPVDAVTTENEDREVWFLKEHKSVYAAGESYKGSDAFSPVDPGTTGNEKDPEVRSLKEQQPIYVADGTGFPGSMIIDVPDAKPMVTDADFGAGKLSNVAGDENNNKDMVTSCEFSNISSHTNPASDLLEIDDFDDVGTRKTQKSGINEVEDRDGPEKGHVSMKTDSTSESISTHHQSVIVIEEQNEPEGLQSDIVSNSQDDKRESKTDSYDKVHGESAIKNLMASSVNNSEPNEIERTSVDLLKKELIHSGAVSDGHAGEPGAAAAQISAVILQGEADSGSVKPQLDTTVGDVLIDSSSRTDSLEGHWGSVSVLSTQSDNPAAIDTETLPSTGSQALPEAEKANIKKSKEEHPDESNKFEPPSFMTLVEGGGSSDPKDTAVSETPTGQNAENPRAGWFPSLTHVANESQGRKKNEKIIEKVANWNVNRHSPLKNLTNYSEPNDGTTGAKVSSTVDPETPVAEPTNVETEKEWNSPRGYPSGIKREKRKGRPFWVQFACCSSVN
ncbi:uncharacterized protein LOC120191340 [Hibiscus syriacus]|uniref:uncharacterized protein LOC120191340 n=1 Tax=Hibiscus syriacus TaxID=106335 RepID=UPI001922890C|nr:uncharacterized protein LOC120191340 [Hibiscus syriacus]